MKLGTVNTRIQNIVLINNLILVSRLILVEICGRDRYLGSWTPVTNTITQQVLVLQLDAIILEIISHLYTSQYRRFVNNLNGCGVLVHNC